MTVSVAELDTEVRLAVFQELVDSGRSLSSSEIAGRLGASGEEVRESLKRLAASRAIVLQPETTDIWMANPFSARATAFTVAAGASRWFGNCIWDSLGILALVKRDGFIETSCPDCDEQLRVEITDGALQPNSAIVHFAVPAAHWWDDIGYT